MLEFVYVQLRMTIISFMSASQSLNHSFVDDLKTSGAELGRVQTCSALVVANYVFQVKLAMRSADNLRSGCMHMNVV